MVQSASQNVVAERQAGTFWSLPSYLGTQFISQFFLISRWLGHESPGLDSSVLRSHLLAEQLADGSGHPGVVYMNYPSYPAAFPLVALGRYLKGVE